jgi:hypothetical protein
MLFFSALDRVEWEHQMIFLLMFLIFPNANANNTLLVITNGDRFDEDEE